MRRLLAPLALAVGLLIPTEAATAAPPERDTFPVDAVIPFPDICAFPLTAHVVGVGHMITFVDASGNPTRGFLGGQLFVTFTRDDTGFSDTFTISGPTFFDGDGTAVRGTGRWTTPMEEVGWVLASGNLQFNGTQDGFSLISSVSGRSQALCDLMSG